MKKSSLILLVLLGLFIISLFGSNIVLKNQYDKIDKTDPFWNYTKLQKGIFHHLMISGGNVTRILFNPGPHASIGVLNYWEQDMKERVKTTISNDTLYLQVEQRVESPGIRDWMKRHILIAISGPELLSVSAMNTDIDLFKLKQRNIAIKLAGKSRLEVESYIPDFDSLYIQLQDSSEVVFEMSEELKTSGTMHLKTLYAEVQGHSLLDVGHFQIKSIHQTIGDTAGIILSGYSLKQMK
jgi:hypothetical protein